MHIVLLFFPVIFKLNRFPLKSWKQKLECEFREIGEHESQSTIFSMNAKVEEFFMSHEKKRALNKITDINVITIKQFTSVHCATFSEKRPKHFSHREKE